jgi:23S rRNA pseudouridine1911/1915/1917 synthase
LLNLDVPAQAAKQRLDRFLSERFPGQSRSQLQSWIRGGRVLVNGARVKTGHLLREGDSIAIREEERSAERLPEAECLPLKVVYEDADIAVVDKPAGLVCHAGAGIRSGTLVNALLYHLGPLQTGDPRRPGIVHRLDKLTSGLLVVARNAAAHQALALQFRNRTVRKEYLALVYGRIAEPGTVTLALGRDPHDRKKISVRARRRHDATTHYRPEGRHGSFSLLRVRIETGRTHQIRVHLAHIGHPVVGDTLYGGQRHHGLAGSELRSAARELNRHFLHAHRLEFMHPRTGERMSFESPLPGELVRFLGLLADPSGAPKGLKSPPQSGAHPA